ncbi:MAG: DNA-binding response regulator [uncultured Campylobacterales bacterium]|uniref:DNA-binding response regulator n=1 Tax=uncultured Campylobacterales bacterium TaxID=352960 RepID=A0A6S6T9Y9_9BACT|nr:MAG: DNA-binding response regulator [uncultured Campylobacterales bacterium]
MIKILMIEDDIELAEIISEYLAQFDMKVTNYDDPFIGGSVASSEDYELLILDLTLPGMDGLEICKDIRKSSDIPIIISSARSDIKDKIEAFDLGADDYLPKPYDPQELLIRIKTILKRYNKINEQGEVIVDKKAFKINTTKHQILFYNKPLQLTLGEYGLLEYLIKKNGDIVSRNEIMYNVEYISADSSKKSVDVIIGRLRNKIESDVKNPKYILSVRGLGYRLENVSQES